MISAGQDAREPAQHAVALGMLSYLPVSLFGAVMGLTGLSIAWQHVHEQYGFPPLLAYLFAAIAIAAFGGMLFGYSVKWITAPNSVSTEFKHPIAGSLFGTFFVSLLLLPIVLAPTSLGFARLLWTIGAVGMVAFAWFRLDRWMSDRQQVAHATPAWIIPVVGLLDVPLAIPALGLSDLHPLMVSTLSVGLFFTIPLFTLIFQRLLFEPPLPDALQPSLLILIAPFSVGFSTYVATTGQIDLFAQVLYFLALFFTSVLLGRLRNLLRCCPFRVSWWAVSFPLAATSIAALRFAAGTPGLLWQWIAWVLLGFTTLVITALLLRTVVGILDGEMRELSS
jgi:tellurite resistance protein